MITKKGSEANEQEIFVLYLEKQNIPVIPNLNENIWSGIIRWVVKPESVALGIIARIEQKMKKMGKRKGVPDLFIPYPSGRYHGMYIEMKYGKNKATNEQMEWLQRLSKLGYYCVICYSAKQAITAFEKYKKG